MKHRSFAKAALALSVTPGAIGQQIRNLETWIGTPLFVRSVRQVVPTGIALNYWAEIQPALLQIRTASSSLKNRLSDEVWLSMPPSLAAKWFARRMGRFMTAHPDIVLHLSASAELSDFSHGPAQLAIRYFDGKDPELEAVLLKSDEARLYCSPDYAARLDLNTPDDLARATLLHSTMHPHWDEWLGLFTNLSSVGVAAIPARHFDLSSLALEAARQGLGVVLSSAMLTEDEIEQGSLCEPFPHRLSLSRGYFVVFTRAAPLSAAAQRVAQWLLSAA